MKIAYIGCVQLSYLLLEHLVNDKRVNVAGIITREYSSFNADFQSLKPIAVRHGIPCYFDSGNKQAEMAAWLRNLDPDIIYCFGWPYLLNKEILEISDLGIVGYHPAALPRNRGRHPIIWALALGLSDTASTFFFMDEGADSGDILHQESVVIEEDEDAASLYLKLSTIAIEQVTDFTGQLIGGTYKRIPQDHSSANYWRKRSKEDGKIDWRMSATSIYNLVRALTKPYVGAHCMYGNQEVKIWKVEMINSQFHKNIEPGKVISSDNEIISVKCGDGAIRIVQHNFEDIPRKGEYL